MHVFDLNENKNEAMCEQKVVRKAKLTKLVFNPNPKSPCLLVGDDHGAVSSLKLSPNLRWTAGPCSLAPAPCPRRPPKRLTHAPCRGRRCAVTKADAERKAKAAEEAAAAGGRPSHRAQPKKNLDDGAPKLLPKEQEVAKLNKILEVAAKTGEFTCSDGVGGPKVEG